MQGRFTTILVGKEKIPLFIHKKDFSDVEHFNRIMDGDDYGQPKHFSAIRK